MDEQEEVQQNNMISNLPLLFANGYPTSLDKITESQLENFIPFMVQCSLGHINLQGKIDYSEPEWWPEDLLFYIPFTKPKRFSGNWIEKMKDVVVTCYQFHRSLFLLKFCNDLASYEHASLRFINNYNSTTSLFDRRSNKLLVTFRNENMSYDQPQRTRKCLLQQKSKNGCQIGQEQIMVEPAPFDIYLCDNCDAELYSKEAILEHEKTCNVDDDDVILCDTPEPDEHVSGISLDGQGIVEHNDEQRIGFLLNFNLLHRDRDLCDATTTASSGVNFTIATNSVSTKKSSKLAETIGIDTTAVTTSGVSNAKEESSGFMIIDRNKRMPRRNRAVHSLTRCPTIPLSSPAGQMLLRTTKTLISKEYLAERLDRLERFCQAPLLSKQSTKLKYLDKRHSTNTPHCTFKKPQEYSAHVYVFPRRQFSQRRRRQNLFFLNSSLLRRCRPISVRLKKITEHEMSCKRNTSSSKLNIKLTRDTSRSSNWKISSSTSSTEIIVDTIDLCSSDDEKPENEHSNIKMKHSTWSIGQSTITATPVATSPSRNSSAAIVRASISKTLTDASSSGVSNIRPRSCLKKIGSEISIIPIRKSLNADSSGIGGGVTSNTTNTRFDSSSVTKTAVLKLVADATATKITTDSHLSSGKSNGGLNEGNTRVSQTSGSLVAVNANSHTNNVAQAKPLRSVYILSNHVRNYPLTAIVSANDLVVAAAAAAANSSSSPIDTSNLRGQENQRLPPKSAVTATSTPSTVRPTFTAKRTGTLTTVTSSLALSSSATTTASAAISTPTTTDWYDALDREHSSTTRNLTLMQSFGSPSRVISIDLTS